MTRSNTPFEVALADLQFPEGLPQGPWPGIQQLFQAPARPVSQTTPSMLSTVLSPCRGRRRVGTASAGFRSGATNQDSSFLVEITHLTRNKTRSQSCWFSFMTPGTEAWASPH